MAKTSAQPIVLGVFALALIAFLVKVVWTPHGSTPEHLPAPAAESYALSPAVDLDVYLDSSGSIRHLLAEAPAGRGEGEPVRFNYLRDLLNKTEAALASAPGTSDVDQGGWNGNTIRFWRFGDRVTELPGQGALQAIGNTPGTFTASRTRIEDPIEHTPRPTHEGERPEVKIVITDLYQSGGALERPAEALAGKYLTNDAGAVGVLGVRNPLDGEVEDLPGTAAGQALPHAADTMPFYVIVAGLAPDVRHTMDTLIEHTGLKQAREKGLLLEVFFSRRPGVRSAVPAKIEGTDFSPITDNFDGQGIAMIGLPGSGTVKATWPGDASQAIDLAGRYRLTPTVTAFDREGRPSESAEAAGAVTPCASGVCATLDGSKLTKGTVYRVRLDRVATDTAATLEPGSEMLKPWNIERQDAERIARGTRQFPPDPPLSGNPGKTPDLSKFLTTLQGAMFHTPLRTGSYFLYVQAE